MTAPKLDIERIRVDAGGYDATGAYWGAGPDAFIATSPNGRDEIAVRARTIKDARQKISAELDRKPGAPQIDRESLGGPPRKTRYEIAWRNPVTGDTIKVRITHARDYLSSGTDHIEVESLAPRKAPLPITETRYRSHFMSALELVNAGGPVTPEQGSKLPAGSHYRRSPLVSLPNVHAASLHSTVGSVRAVPQCRSRRVLSISPRPRGANLKLPHPTGIVVGHFATIGNNVTIYQHVTIGARAQSQTTYPTIGDAVTIYAGAVLIGPICVGRGAIIGANAVVTRSVPPHNIAVGVPARQLKARKPLD